MGCQGTRNQVGRSLPNATDLGGGSLRMAAAACWFLAPVRSEIPELRRTANEATRHEPAPPCPPQLSIARPTKLSKPKHGHRKWARRRQRWKDQKAMAASHEQTSKRPRSLRPRSLGSCHQRHGQEEGGACQTCTVDGSHGLPSSSPLCLAAAVILRLLRRDGVGGLAVL